VKPVINEKLLAAIREVLELLVKGYSYKDVSKELRISTSTVGTCVQRICEKLHVSSRREIMERSGKEFSPRGPIPSASAGDNRGETSPS